jgi:hypothetical protein
VALVSATELKESAMDKRTETALWLFALACAVVAVLLVSFY